jgi:hypothetical protein
MVEKLFSIPFIASGRSLGLIIVVSMFFVILYLMTLKKEIFIRRIAGLDAIEEAVGRAAEMNKPVICSYGVAQTGFDHFTLAGLAILARVAELTAKTGTRLIVPTGGSDQSLPTRPIAEEIVKTAYTMAGRPEAFTPNDIPFLTGQQYPYTGGYVGIIQRVKPAAIISVGSHSNENLNIVDTGRSIGAITIANCHSITNTTIVACAADYFLIGEEVMAAAAYLSNDVSQKACIKCQDVFKVIAIILMVVGISLTSLGNDLVKSFLMS